MHRKQAGWKKTENARPIISISLLDDTLEKIEDTRFEKRFNSRSETIEYILSLGLKVLEKRKERQQQIV